MGFFDKMIDTVSAAGKTVADKTKSVADTANVSYLLSSEEKSYDKMLTDIGRIFYAANKDNPPQEYIELFAKLDLSEKKQAELKAKLSEIKGIKLCPVCGTELVKGAKFCGKCGNAIADEDVNTNEEIKEDTVENTENAD